MTNCEKGVRRWGEMGSATGGAPECWDAGLLHVHEERTGAAARRQLTLALLGGFPGLLTVLAPDREGQRTQALLRDFVATVETVAVAALLEAGERVVHLVQGLGLHLDQRELQLFLDVGFRALDGVEHFVQLAAPRAFLTHAAHLALDFSLQLATPIVEHRFQIRVAGPGLRRRRFLLLSLHDRRSFRPGASRVAILKIAELLCK